MSGRIGKEMACQVGEEMERRSWAVGHESGLARKVGVGPDRPSMGSQVGEEMAWVVRSGRKWNVGVGLSWWAAVCQRRHDLGSREGGFEVDSQERPDWQREGSSGRVGVSRGREVR